MRLALAANWCPIGRRARQEERMEWRDQGILLSSRTHGETSAIIEVFTPQRGRHAGVVRGGASRKMAPVLQPGAQLDVAWRARLEDHIGTFSVEPVRSRAAASMGDRLSLAGLNAVVSLLLFCLPEREAHERLYRRTEALLDLLRQYAQTKRLDLDGSALSGVTPAGLSEISSLCPDVEAIFTRPDSKIDQQALAEFGTRHPSARCVLLGREVSAETYGRMEQQLRDTRTFWDPT